MGLFRCHVKTTKKLSLQHKFTEKRCKGLFPFRSHWKKTLLLNFQCCLSVCYSDRKRGKIVLLRIAIEYGFCIVFFWIWNSSNEHILLGFIETENLYGIKMNLFFKCKNVKFHRISFNQNIFFAIDTFMYYLEIYWYIVFIICVYARYGITWFVKNERPHVWKVIKSIEISVFTKYRSIGFLFLHVLASGYFSMTKFSFSKLMFFLRYS